MIKAIVGMVGIEPTLPFGNGFLRPARLPIPPRPPKTAINGFAIISTCH